MVERLGCVSDALKPPPHRQLMSRVVMTGQGPVIDYYSSYLPQGTSHPTFCCRRRLMPQELTIPSANAFFDDFFYYRPNTSGPIKHGQTNNMFKQAEPVHCSFRPLGINNTDNGLPSSSKPIPSIAAAGPQPPELTTPSVLQTTVDTSQYEHVSYEDWLMAPADYGISPPSSINSKTVTPVNLHSTGVDSLLDYYSQKYAAKGGYGSTFDDHSMLDMKPALPTSTIYSTHGLPSFVTTPNLPPIHKFYDGPANYFQQPRQIMGVSPQDIEPVPSIMTPTDASSSYGTTTQEASTPLDESSESASDSDDDLETQEARIKSEEDAILVKMREEGYSYKDIKSKTKLKVAESTLRGRYRTLTKHASQRVRKPQWKSNDIRLLRQAVARFQSKSRNKKGQARPHGRGGLPWEKIGNWMVEHGSSYHFAPATCAKKWEETKKSG